VYHLTRLQNGLTVATAEMPHMASAVVGLWVGVGSRFEPATISGAAHFIEHLLFKGTQRRTARQISESVEGVGGYLNAFTTEEQTCFHARAQARHFADLLEVLTDMFLNSQFAPADIAKERDVIKEEIAMYRDEPNQYVHDLLHAAIWPDQPLGRPLTGTEKTLDHIRRSDLLDFYERNYVASNTLIVIAGPLRHGEALRHVRRIAPRFKTGSKPGFSPARTSQTGPIVCLYNRRVEQSQIALGVRTCSRHDERRHGLRVLNAVLGESMSSRLFQILREDKGLAYSVYSSWALMEDTGVLTICAGLEHTDLEKALRIIVRELRALCLKPVGAGELRRARDYLIGQMELNLEGTENQMNWLGESLLAYGRIVTPESARERLSRVTAAEVRSVARDFFVPERLNLALISPLKKTSALERILHW